MKKKNPKANLAHQNFRHLRKKAARQRAQLVALTGDPTPIGPLIDRVVRGENLGFKCANCGAPVAPPGAGSGSEHRNHCPHCLHSVHLDLEPGDRAADCGAVMEPVAVWVRRGGEWALIHRCRGCGALSSNRIAADDDRFALLSLGAKPLAQPPFPIDRDR